ncbi:MAG: hypothetical protein HY438_04110 [DPANN group archaeon]|nr:hypothetical protein [DPANN group archaeon]
MARQAKEAGTVSVQIRPLSQREEIIVMDALFARPSRLSDIADSISQKVEGPDISNENLQAILGRLQKGRFVRSAQTKEGVFWYLTKRVYEARHKEAVQILNDERSFYYRRVDALKQNGNSPLDYIASN